MGDFQNSATICTCVSNVSTLVCAEIWNSFSSALNEVMLFHNSGRIICHAVIVFFAYIILQLLGVCTGRS